LLLNFSRNKMKNKTLIVTQGLPFFDKEVGASGARAGEEREEFVRE
jgi:hypothetical protein